MNSPTSNPTLNPPEFWQRKGYELVSRYGNFIERGEMAARQAEVRQINLQTQRWLAEQRRQAA